MVNCCCALYLFIYLFIYFIHSVGFGLTLEGGHNVIYKTGKPKKHSLLLLHNIMFIFFLTFFAFACELLDNLIKVYFMSQLIHNHFLKLYWREISNLVVIKGDNREKVIWIGCVEFLSCSIWAVSSSFEQVNIYPSLIYYWKLSTSYMMNCMLAWGQISLFLVFFYFFTLFSWPAVHWLKDSRLH